MAEDIQEPQDMAAGDSSELMATRITRHEGHVSAEVRSNLLRQTGATLWFTGLSGSGKSTAAFTLEHALIQTGHVAYVLDGDNIRFGLNAAPKILAEKRDYPEAMAKRFGLGFSADDRQENIRRIGEVACLFNDCGIITMASFISPFRIDRDRVRALHVEKGARFIEIHLKTPIEVCEQRDPKGLYRQARAGEIKGFTGIDDPYEEPLHPELVFDASQESPQEMTLKILGYLRKEGILKD